MLINSFEPPTKEELQRRLNHLCKKMIERNIDFGIFFQNVDIYYFTGTAQKSVLIITSNGDLFFFVKKSRERAIIETPFDIIEESDDTNIIKFLKANGIKGICGMELDIIPANVYIKWSKSLDITDVIDISPILREIRMIKSDYEIEQIKKSGEIVDKVFSKAKEIIKEGLTELEIASELEVIGRKAGHPGALRMRGFNQEMDNITITQGYSGIITSYADAPILGAGIYPSVPHGASIKKIEKEIPILIDYGACFNGYLTDETRPFVIGRLREDFIKPYECALEIINMVINTGKEGANASDIFKSAYNIVERYKLEDYFMGYGEGKVSFLGHGLGLEINEFPVITAKHHIILREGMVFAVEPKFIIPNKGVVGIELDFIVRKDRLERVTKSPYYMQVI